MPDLIGSALGPYRILEQIGLGGMVVNGLKSDKRMETDKAAMRGRFYG